MRGGCALGLRGEARERLAVGIERGDLEHGDAQWRAGPAPARAPAAVLPQVAQHPLEAQAVPPLDAESARHVVLG